MNAWTLSQTESLESATRWGLNWTMNEIELVETTMDEKVSTVASVLERSLYAVSTMRGLVRDGHSISQLAFDRTRKVIVSEKICQKCHLIEPLTGCECGE